MGDLNYQGTWNASTNTPTLTSSAGTKGFYYVVSVAGSTNLNGITDWKVGDWAVFNGSVWEKIDNTDAVTSVNGFTGTVVLTTTNIAEGTNEYFTTAKARASVSAGTGISYDSGTGVISNTSPSLGGDVVGPASATDNAVARFDTTTGKLIQNSVVTIDDSGNISGANSISTIDYAQLDTTAAASIAVGKLRWNVDTATAAFGIIDGTTEVNIGQQMYAYVTNAESVTITAGQAVYLYQATGNRASVKLAYNTGDATSAKTLGLVTQDIGANQTGFVTTQGVLGKLNTGAYSEGDTLYLGATAGSLTTTKPKAPNHLVYIGVVERANNGNGQIYVRVQNGYELDEIHDVQINSPANGQTLLYDASTSLWKNANLTAGTGISISNGAASATITNSAPDQTVAITGAGGAVVTGTYPNFTITTPSGTVTSVTGTAPIASTGGATPAISMAAANTSTNGYLTSTDWNTFNGKGSGTVTSVGGTGTVNGITLTGTVTSSGNLTLGGTLGGIGNSQLTNSAVTIGSTSVSLGGTATTLSGLTSVTSTTVVASGVVGSSATGALTMPSGTTAERPGSPVAGMIRYNTTLGLTEYYNGTAWYSVTATAAPPTVEYLVVGGGGGGGVRGGGGGGAGGFRTNTGLAVTQGSAITVTVGAGGAGQAQNPGSTSRQGLSGSDSVFGSITATGGGGGGAYGGINGTSGGSGGGAGDSRGGSAAGSGNTPSTSPSQGNDGGATGGVGSSAGGGGASAAGSSAPSGIVGGAGGNGTASSISGSSVTYAGGGGGQSVTVGAGGTGGGGAGGISGTSGVAGTANTGGGGGGYSNPTDATTANGSGSGGSGVVIIRYSDIYAAAASTTGSPSITVAGGYRVYRWTGSGSITF
jgi:hypothetical protein